jgi:hypothetical protein
MKALVLTDTMTYTESTKKGVKTFSLSVNEFGGYSENNENGKIIKRAKIGRAIQIAKGSDRKTFTQYIKKCRAAGDIIELEGENLRYGIE